MGRRSSEGWTCIIIGDPLLARRKALRASRLRGSRLRVEFAGVEDPMLLDQNIPVWLTNIRIAGFGATAR